LRTPRHCYCLQTLSRTWHVLLRLAQALDALTLHNYAGHLHTHHQQPHLVTAAPLESNESMCPLDAMSQAPEGRRHTQQQMWHGWLLSNKGYQLGRHARALQLQHRCPCTPKSPSKSGEGAKNTSAQTATQCIQLQKTASLTAARYIHFRCQSVAWSCSFSHTSKPCQDEVHQVIQSLSQSMSHSQQPTGW
jgi:hypothetical protein